MSTETAPDMYRGVRVPARLTHYWNAPTGRWWRAGVDAKADLLPFEVVPTQVYRDNDYRKPGRTLRVDRITEDGVFAICTVLTNYDRVQDCLDHGWTHRKDMRGSQTAIRVRRLYPNARGYALIQDVGEQVA